MSKLIDHNLVSNKKTSAGLDRVLTEEPVDDQIYFSISDTCKNSSEQLTDDSQGIPDSSQINVVPPIKTSILDMSTEFLTENLYGSKSKENNLIPPLNTNTLQFSENSTIPSIPTDCNTPQLANIVDKLSTNQDMEKIKAQLIAMKSCIKCEISSIDQKMKSLYECFNGVKETGKPNEALQKNVSFLKNELIRMDEIIKSLLETQASILKTYQNHQQEQKKEEEKVSPKRN